MPGLLDRPCTIILMQMKLVEDYVPLVILWLIWYSERPYVALKGLEDDLDI